MLSRCMPCNSVFAMLPQTTAGCSVLHANVVSECPSHCHMLTGVIACRKHLEASEVAIGLPSASRRSQLVWELRDRLITNARSAQHVANGSGHSGRGDGANTSNPDNNAAKQQLEAKQRGLEAVLKELKAVQAKAATFRMPVERDTASQVILEAQAARKRVQLREDNLQEIRDGAKREARYTIGDRSHVQGMLNNSLVGHKTVLRRYKRERDELKRTREELEGVRAALRNVLPVDLQP